MKILFFCSLFVVMYLTSVDGYSCSNYSMLSLNESLNDKEPAVFGDYVVWSSSGNIVLYGLLNDIFLNVTGGDWWKEDADIFDRKIVWVGYEPDAQIYSCDIRRNGSPGGCFLKDRKLKMTNDFSLKVEPVIYEDFIFWSQHDGNDFEVFGCDISKNGLLGGCLEDDAKIQITYNDYNDGSIDVFGRYVIWESYVNDWDIYYLDIYNKKTTLLVNNTNNQRQPRIFFDGSKYYIFYWSNELGNDDIFYIDMANNLSGSLTEKSGFDEWGPVVNNFGNKKIIWNTNRHGASNIEGLSFNGYFNAGLFSWQQNPDIYDGTIVFEVAGSGRNEVWAGYC